MGFGAGAGATYAAPGPANRLAIFSNLAKQKEQKGRARTEDLVFRETLGTSTLDSWSSETHVLISI